MMMQFVSLPPSYRFDQTLIYSYYHNQTRQTIPVFDFHKLPV